jgi:hypothetical protein
MTLRLPETSLVIDWHDGPLPGATAMRPETAAREAG